MNTEVNSNPIMMSYAKEDFGGSIEIMMILGVFCKKSFYKPVRKSL